jgi:hypothetical protein
MAFRSYVVIQVVGQLQKKLIIIPRPACRQAGLIPDRVGGRNPVSFSLDTRPVPDLLRDQAGV